MKKYGIELEIKGNKLKIRLYNFGITHKTLKKATINLNNSQSWYFDDITADKIKIIRVKNRNKVPIVESLNELDELITQIDLSD